MKKKVATKGPNEKKNITKKEDFELFQKEFLNWVVRFGLQDWELLFIHDKIASEARVDLFLEDKVAHVALSVDWADHEVNKDTISDAARHEAIHLALGMVDHLANNRFVSKRDLEIAVEDAVRRISHGIGSLIEE